MLSATAAPTSPPVGVSPPVSPSLSPPPRGSSTSPGVSSPLHSLNKDANAENSPDLALRIRWFVERNAVYHASVVYRCAPGEPFVHAPPYQCLDPLNPPAPPTGKSSYPTVFRYPPDLDPQEHWLSVIALLKQVDRFLGPLSPPFQYQDQRADAVYWLCQLDPRHFLLLIYYTPPGTRKKRTPSTRSLNARRRTTRAFLQQTSFILRHHSVFSLLQGL
jgi:KICSTOR complex C12orf66 like